MPVTFTTDLPDVGQPTLDASIEGEITVSWVDTIDYGQYRVQIEEVGNSYGSKQEFQTHLTHDGPTEYTFTGLKDGERYKVRLRTQTEHKTGSWTADETEITPLYAPDSINATSQSSTEVEITWNDNSNGDTAFKILESERHPEDGYQSFEVAGEVSGNTTSTTVSGINPGRDLRFKVEAYTDHANTRSSGYDSTSTIAEFPCGRGGVIYPLGDYEEIYNATVEGDWVKFGDIYFNSDTDLSLVLEGQFDIHATVQHITGDTIISFEVAARAPNATADTKIVNLSQEAWYRMQFDGVLAKTASGRAHGESTNSGEIQFNEVAIPYE